MFLQQGMHVEARFEIEQSANLRLAERAGAVAVYREGLERPSRTTYSALARVAVLWCALERLLRRATRGDQERPHAR